MSNKCKRQSIFWIFSIQRKSRGIHKYNFAHCLIECRMKFIISECNCIPFFFPESCKMLNSVKQRKHSKFAYFSALNESSRTRTCQMADMHCLDRIRVQTYSVAPPDNAAGFERISNKSKIGLKCDCLPGCHETVCRSLEKNWKWTDSYIEFLFMLFLDIYFSNITDKPA